MSSEVFQPFHDGCLQRFFASIDLVTLIEFHGYDRGGKKKLQVVFSWQVLIHFNLNAYGCCTSTDMNVNMMLLVTLLHI